MCNNCNQNSCCGNCAIQIVGPPGVMGPNGPQGEIGLGGGMMFGMHGGTEQILITGSELSSSKVLIPTVFLTIQPTVLYPILFSEPSFTGANVLVNNGIPGTFKRLFIRVIANTIFSPIVFTLRKNGVNTLISITVPASTGALDYFDNVNTVSCNGTTDEFCIGVAPTADYSPIDAYISINQFQIWLI